MKTVTVYLLDGKKISAQDLAGKSGKVTIRFIYENHSKKQITVGKNEETLAVPYLAITGTMFYKILPTPLRLRYL